MKLHPTLLMLLLIGPMPHCLAQPIEAQPYAEGVLLKVALQSAPFPSGTRSQQGHHYNDKHYPAAQHYSDSTVAIFIPKGFERGDSADYIVHFHGWWNNIDSTLSSFQLAEQLSNSGKNTILVIPQGPKNAPDSHGGKLEAKNAFKLMMQEVSRTVAHHLKLRSLPARHIILSGHSGGYRAMSYILLHGGMAPCIKEVWLFDGLYSQLEKYAMWLERSGHRLVFLYTDDGGTYYNTLDFRNSLEAWQLPYTNITQTKSADLPAIAPHGTVFWHTDLGHNEVLHHRRQFQHLLHNTNWLKDISETK